MPVDVTSKRALWSYVPRAVPAGLVVGLLAAGLWLARWLAQGPGTMWTDTARRFYVPDATLGYVTTEATWVWLGLDGLGVIVGLVVGTLALVPLVRWTEGRGISKVLRFLALCGGALLFLAPLVPAWAFVSGTPPAGAELTMQGGGATHPSGPLAVSARHFVVADNVKANLLAVRIDAGGETFDARFEALAGTAALDPLQATLVAQAGSIQTGVALRDQHAREYLMVEQHAAITLTLHDIVLANDGSYTAKGDCTLLGKTLPVAVTGTLGALDATQRKDLGIEAPEALLANGTFTVSIKATPLDPKNFDSDQLVVTARVALVPSAAEKQR